MSFSHNRHGFGWKIPLCFLYLITILLCIWSSPVRGELSQATADKLMSLAPRISLEEKSIHSFLVKGRVHLDKIRFCFFAAGNNSGKLSLLLLDPQDGTPILAGANNLYMIYDPVAAEVLVGENKAMVYLDVEEEKGSPGAPDEILYNVEFAFFVGSGKKQMDETNEFPATTIFDLKRLMRPLLPPVSAVKQTNGTYLLQGKTKEGSQLIAYVNPDRPQGAFQRVELFQAKHVGVQPFLVLDTIILNQPVPDTLFSFPLKKLKDSGLTINQIPKDAGTFKNLLNTSKLFRTLIARMIFAGLEGEEFKSVVENMSLRPLNWDEMQHRDEKASRILREVFPKIEGCRK